MSQKDRDEAATLAHEALHELLEGTDLHGAIVKASTVAALRGDVEERAWFQFQLADFMDTDADDVPDDFFRLRRNIDVVPDRAEQHRIFLTAKHDFLDSRTDPDDPNVIYDATLAKMDDWLAKYKLLEDSAGGDNEIEERLVKQNTFLKLVRERIAERTERYLRSVVGP
jgi:hypothetical protein